MLAVAVTAGAATVGAMPAFASGAAGAAAMAPSATTVPAAHTAGGGTWGKAIEVPGTAALNRFGEAHITSVSCASAGNCTAGGDYLDGSDSVQAFVASQAHGTWGKAIEVPGTAALNTGGLGGIDSVSCASAGNCTAGGHYRNSSGGQVFVVSQSGGIWGKAIEVPGTAALNQAGNAAIFSVSCASAGNCTAGGYYFDSAFRAHAFVASQSGGIWGKAIEVPGTAALNIGGNASVISVSCASAGNCTAGGQYLDSFGHFQAFVASQRGGTWGKALQVPGTGELSQGKGAFVTSVSCAAAGNCSAVGDYSGRRRFSQQAFVISQTGGTWGKAIEVPGTAALNRGHFADITSVSCVAAGNCRAGGSYLQRGHSQAFVVSRVGGAWGKAIEVPGTGALNGRGFAKITSVSCTAAGTCGAGGYYDDGSGHQQAFVVSQTGGTWGTAIEVPGTGALNQGGEAGITSVSCTAAGTCSAVGTYLDGALGQQVFVVSRT
jgi:hypothetical protein